MIGIPISQLDFESGSSPNESSSLWSRVTNAVRMPSSVLVSIGVFVLFVVLFEILRLGMYLRNRDLAADTDAIIIAKAFLTGMRFDLAMAAYVSIGLLTLSKLAGALWRAKGELRVYAIGAIICGTIFVFAGLGEYEFYREYFSRFNRLAIQYLSQPGTVMSMIWNGFPVLRYLLAGVALNAGFSIAVLRLARSDRCRPEMTGSTRLISNAGWTIVQGCLLFLAARGSLGSKPLTWGDSVLGPSAFANHLAQNGFWMIGGELFGGTGHNPIERLARKPMPGHVARERVQNLLMLPHEELTGDFERYPLLRSNQYRKRSVSLTADSDARPNVVLIMMESFTARYCGAVGSDCDLTPEFNRLAEHGILFDRCFSNGTRTHQAHYAAVACFPSLPTAEWLMQDKRGSQRFDSIPNALKLHGYRTIYFHNNYLDWDNVYGFFRFQGMDKFVGRLDFEPRTNFFGTWGVLDNVLFDRAIEEFARMDGPFFATIMTASNHIPFQAPRPLPFPEETGDGKWADRKNGVRYSDWAIGQFFESVRHQPFFRNTLFVIVGDHGICMSPVLTEANLLHHHVPLLFYAPALLGETPRRIHAVASHVDLGPTILGLLGETRPHQHWGRDLFSLAEDDEGFAIFKPTSGSELCFARGDNLLVKTRDGGDHLYRYDLGFPPRVDDISADNRVLLEEMDTDLRAYIQLGLEVLNRFNVAP